MKKILIQVELQLEKEALEFCNLLKKCGYDDRKIHLKISTSSIMGFVSDNGYATLTLGITDEFLTFLKLTVPNMSLKVLSNDWDLDFEDIDL